MNTKVKPIAPYLGGKSKLAKIICPIIDNTEHKLSLFAHDNVVTLGYPWTY